MSSGEPDRGATIACAGTSPRLDPVLGDVGVAPVRCQPGQAGGKIAIVEDVVELGEL